MFILFTNLFLTRSFRLENTLECYNLRGGQGGFTEVVCHAEDFCPGKKSVIIIKIKRKTCKIC
jgi:hypothetical protein